MPDVLPDIYIIRPTSCHLFLGIGILQETGRRGAGEGAGEMELSPLKFKYT